jgi:hypothetical protein
MKIFGILKVDDKYSLKQYPLDGVRLDPLSAPTNQSDLTTTPPDRVSVFLTKTQIL